MSQLRTIDFFCGAGGMSYGMRRAGIEVLAGIDNDPQCRTTYERNIAGATFIQEDIARLSAPELGRRLEVERNDPRLILAGCSPCQYWTKLRTDKTKSEKSAFLLKNFQRFVRFFQPGFVVVENVPGMMTNQSESVLPGFLDFLGRLGYSYAHGIVNANHYGVPQNRIRYLLVATRLPCRLTLPPPKTDDSLVVRRFIGTANGFPRIPAGHRDSSKFAHTAAGLSPLNLRRIQLTPKSGGDRSAWRGHADLQIDAYRGRDDIFRDVYGRMSWDRPAPTITTRFISLSNGRFGHPDEDRAISLREGATLQTFPKSFRFLANSQASMARHIGNAVPPAMAERIGRQLLRVYHGKV